MSIINLNEKNFKDTIESNETVLVDFWAPWCGPCRMLAPVLEELNQKNPNLVIGKVNVDEEEVLGSMFNVMSIPTMCIFKNGKLVKTTVGLKRLTDLEVLVK